MKKPHFYFIAGVATILLPAGIFILFIWGLNFALEKAFTNSKNKDDVNILSTTLSPDQKFILTIFSYSGGGAAGWSGIRANVRKSEESFDSSDYVFNTNNGTKIQTIWTNDTIIDISYSSDDSHLGLYQKGWNKDKTVQILYNKN